MQVFYKGDLVHSGLYMRAPCPNNLCRSMLFIDQDGSEKSEDVSIGWLGTDAYKDPRGRIVSQYRDPWKYKLPPHSRAWTMQEMELDCRDVAHQGGEKSTP